MKTHIKTTGIILVLLLSMKLMAFPQASSESYYNRLFYLCKAWGYAKYFHTEIAKGTVNWDNELLAAIDGIQSASSDEEFDAILLHMIERAGRMGTSTVPLPEVPDELNIIGDLSWMDDLIFSPEIKEWLQEIHVKFRPQPNYYTAMSDGSPPGYFFANDQQYYNGDDYPSEAMRLLALFRFWNVQNYFLPYKNQLVTKLDPLLSEFIPRIAGASNELEYHLCLKELTSRMFDAHSMYHSPVYDNWVGTYYPPFQVRIIENQIVISKVLPGFDSLAVGDIIKEIDGVNIDTLRKDLRKYGHGSNSEAIDFTVVNLFMSGDSGRSTLKVFNGNSISTVEFERNSVNLGDLLANDSPIWTTRVVGNRIFGIVDMTRLLPEQVERMFSDLWFTNAIIFDIRGYPQMTYPVIVSYLYPEPLHIADFTKPDLSYPGTFYWKKIVSGTGTTNPYGGKVVMLFDDRTRSQAELTCMALEPFPGAIKIGSTTAGADGPVTIILLPGNSLAIMNGQGCYYPDGTQRSRNGIIPEYEVRPTIEGIRAGKDEVLAAAFSVILGSNTETVPTFTVSAYPNPVAAGPVWISTTTDHSGILEFSMLDVCGKTIKGIKHFCLPGEQIFEFDLAGVARGLYLMKVSNDSGTITKKVLVN